MRYWRVTTVLGPATRRAVNGGPMEPVPLLDQGHWEATANLFDEDGQWPALEVATAIGYTMRLAVWNLEHKLRQRGYAVVESDF